METTHAGTTTNRNKIMDLLRNPAAIGDALKNPGKFGLDFYKSLSTRNKQYLAFAGAIGLIVYGVILGRKK